MYVLICFVMPSQAFSNWYTLHAECYTLYVYFKQAGYCRNCYLWFRVAAHTDGEQQYMVLRCLGVSMHENSYMLGDNRLFANPLSISHAKLYMHHSILSFFHVFGPAASMHIGICFHFD